MPPGEPIRATSSPGKASSGKASRRRELVSAAKRLFIERGFDQTSVSAIVREVGVAQGTFYLYFKSKQAVLPYLRAEVLNDYLRAAEQAMAGEGPADARLVSAVQRVHEVMRAHLELIRVFRQATSTEEIEQIWIEGRETLARPFAALLELGREDGSFAFDDARMAAHLALALLDDLLFESLVWQRPAPPAQTLSLATRFVLRGLGSSPARIDALVPIPITVPVPVPVPSSPARPNPHTSEESSP